MLKLESINKKFANLSAVKDVSLSIESGEFISFLGPSGCGKTTLLRLISGFETVSSGKIIYKEQDLTEAAPEKRPFGIVFQTYALFPNLSVYDNIAFGLRMHKVGKIEVDQIVQSMMQLMHIDNFKNYMPAQLSGGQQQRVALARSLALKPEVILLDEPLSALDAAIRVHLRSEIKNLQRDLGITIIYVTHDQEEAMAMADRIAIMNQGSIVQLDSPENIYTHPSDSFVAGFIGSMNLLEGIFENHTFKCSGIQLSLPNCNLTGRGTVAIRPEHLSLANGDSADLKGEIIYISHLGATIRVVFTCGESELMIDLPGSYYAEFKQRTGPIHVNFLPEKALAYSIDEK